ncbi:MAG: hypothetical protein MJZ34_13925 [Paludibacteraceae bacterium]|nr:hypothetical protein [Paludibacteraceae bacterium]
MKAIVPEKEIKTVKDLIKLLQSLPPDADITANVMALGSEVLYFKHAVQFDVKGKTCIELNFGYRKL